jgi:glycine/D-amino acid oxidase-like deaminating enzyme
MTGGLMIGFPDSVVVQGTLNSIATHSLSHQIFSAIELKERYPVLTPPSSEIIGVFETEAGYLIPEACITAHCAIAEENGALLKYQESLLSWKQSEKQPELVEITTDAGRYLTKKLVLTVGAWAPELYGSTINLELRTERRVLYWFRPSNHNDSFKVFPLLLSISASHRTSLCIFGTPESIKEISSMAFRCKVGSQRTLSRLLFISHREISVHQRQLIEMCLPTRSIKSGHFSPLTFPPLAQGS